MPYTTFSSNEPPMIASLTESSVNAISKVISNKVQDNVHDLIANTIRSEFNNEISEPLVYKITLATIQKLHLHS